MITLALGGCFSPKVQEGLACSDIGECPNGQSCTSGFCEGSGIDGGASSIDAAVAVDVDADPECDDVGGVEPSSETFEYTGTIVSFTVPACVGTVTIEAFGAQGGGIAVDEGIGGKGARIKGEFNFEEGAELQVLVGGRGIDGLAQGPNSGGSGGGGSFVVSALDDPVLIAGGGGGAKDGLGILPGGVGQITEAGQDGDAASGGMGGVDGNGGTRFSNPNGYHGGTGGGGFSGDGVGDSDGRTPDPDNPDPDVGTANGPGTRFLSGGMGGVAGSVGRNGGFGGGGSSGYTGSGGGGYSGGSGGGATTNLTYSGGGGGSINLGALQDNSPGVQVGNGQVIISW